MDYRFLTQSSVRKVGCLKLNLEEIDIVIEVKSNLKTNLMGADIVLFFRLTGTPVLIPIFMIQCLDMIII